MRRVSVSGKRVYVGLRVCIKLYVLHPFMLFVFIFIVSFCYDYEFFSPHCHDSSFSPCSLASLFRSTSFRGKSYVVACCRQLRLRGSVTQL